jgi:MFS family permease
VTAPAAARRFRLTPRVIAAMLAGLVVALVGVLFLGAALAGELSAKSFWSASGVLLIVLVIAAVGQVVARHQPRNPIGWLLAGESVFILLVIVAGFCADLMYRHGRHGLPMVGPAVLALSQLFGYSLIGFPLVILLFPDGRLPSRRWRSVVWAYLAITGAAVLATVIASVGIAIGQHVVVDKNGNLVSLGRGGTAWLIPVQTAFFIAVAVFWLAAVGRQALAWRGSTGERRQQLKWLASGAAVCGVSGIWAVATNSAIWQVLILGFAVLPLSIGIGILKYRLYEIDRIISRTLAYAIVTGLLISVYAGLVLLATRVLGVHGTVAVAAATLAAAALFTPLRRRVQRIVDRRFNRARYDADRTLAAFAVRLQDAVDLDTVRGDLLAAVAGSLEPAHVSMWIAGGSR